MSYNVVSNQELFGWMRVLYPIELNVPVTQLKVHLDYVKNKSFIKVRFYGEENKKTNKLGKLQTKIIELDQDAVDKIYRKLQTKMELPKFVNSLTFEVKQDVVPEFDIKMIPLIKDNEK